MLRSKILFSISAGTLIYVLISFFGGQNGLWAMRQLEEQKEQLSMNVGQVMRINDELFLEYTSLKNDMDVVSAYARRLGYVAENEKLVKVSGLAPYYVAMYDSGVVMRKSEVKFVPEWMCKVMGGTVAILMIVLLVLKDMSKIVLFTTKQGVSSCEAGVRIGGYDPYMREKI